MTTMRANGSVTGSQTWFSYNQPNMIIGGSSSSQFFYDQNHQRWKQVASYTGSPETTLYIGGLLEKMTNATATAYRYYVPVGNNFIVYNRWSTGSNPIYYVTKDHLGSSAVITDRTGALVVGEKFSALGWNENTSAQQATMATVTRHEFTGHEGLDNAGLWMVNMNGRVYIPSGSMFLSPDPTIPDPTNTLSYNRYAYVNYNPLSFADPSGFAAAVMFHFTEDYENPAALGLVPPWMISSAFPVATWGYWDNPTVPAEPITRGADGVEDVPITGSRPVWVSLSDTFNTGWGIGGTIAGTRPVSPIRNVGTGTSGGNPKQGNKPQGNRNRTRTCPSGVWAQIGNALVNGGQDLVQDGQIVATTGFAGVATGTAATALGYPGIGAPLVGGGSAMASVGGWIMIAGIGAQGLGGLILAVNGNSQPLQSAALQGAQTALDQTTHIPDGAPSPYDSITDRLSGTNPCPSP